MENTIDSETIINSFGKSIDETCSSLGIDNNYEVRNLKYDESSGYYSAEIAVKGSKEYYVTCRFNPSDSESLGKFFTYSPGTKGGDSTEGGLNYAQMNSQTGQVTAVSSNLPSNFEKVNGVQNAIDDNTIVPCVSAICNVSSESEGHNSAILTDLALNAVRDTCNNEYETIVVANASAGAKIGDQFIQIASSNPKNDKANIVGAFFDPLDNSDIFGIKIKDNTIEATNKSNVTYLIFESNNFSVGDRNLKNGLKNIGIGNNMGADILAVTMEDMDLPSANHMAPLYLAIKNGQINSMLNGEILNKDANYVLTYCTLDKNGQMIRTTIDKSVFDELENSDYSKEEKLFYYDLKSRCNFENNEVISVEYEAAMRKFENIINYIADSSEIGRSNLSFENANLSNMLAGANAFFDASNILNYKTKNGILAAASEISDVKRTESELTALADSFTFGEDSDSDNSSKFTNVSFFNNLKSNNDDSKYIPGRIGSVTFDEISSIIGANGELIGPLNDRFNEEIEESLYIENEINDLLEDDALYGSAFTNMKLTLTEYKNCMHDRGTYATLLKEVYRENYKKIYDYLDGNDFDDSNLEEYKSCLELNKQSIEEWKGKANIIYTRPKYFMGIKVGYEEYYPFKEDAENAIASLTAVNELMQERVNYIEGFAILLKECDERIRDTEAEIQRTFASDVKRIGDVVIV